MFRDRANFLTGSNSYVPAMQFANGVSKDQPCPFSLGSPAASDDDLLIAAHDSDAVATTEETISWTSDARYGRTLIVTPSGNPGNSYSFDVYGYDYLGQPMIERFTGASGSTAILYGKKAFKSAYKTKVVTAATNAITSKLGTGTRLGLPFKGDVSWVKENSILVPVYKRDVIIWADRSAAKATAGGSEFLRVDFPGFIKTLLGTPNGGGSTNDPVITVELGGTAVTGLAVTIDTSDTAGLTVTDVPTTTGYSANNRFVTNGLIEIVGAAAASAGSDRVGVELTPTQFIHPDLTDPQTATTADPRGTYDSLTTLAGFEIIVAMIGDNAVNTSNNGGLHGIRQYGG